MTWSSNGDRLEAHGHGDVVFADDLHDVESMSDGASLTMRSWSGVIPHTIEVTSRGGRITRTYYVAGRERPWDDQARALLARDVTILVRHSGFGAAARVNAIMQKKGVAGVLEEVDQLDNDYVRRVYLEALLGGAPFNETTILPVLQRINDAMTSDYDRRVLLTSIAAKIPLTVRMTTSYLPAIAKMHSDYDRRQVLHAVLSRRPLAEGVAAAALRAVGTMQSSYDKREVLTQMMSDGPPLTADEKKTLLDAVAAIGTDYDRRVVLLEFLKHYRIDAADRDAFFGAARSITSDYDRAEVLMTVLKSQTIDASMRPAFMAAATGIRSAYDQDRVLAALARAER